MRVAASRRLRKYERQLTAAAKTGVFVSNLGFWFGSLRDNNLVYAIAWTVYLAAVGLLARSRNMRWLLTTVSIFGGIHFFTQWFWRMSLSAESLVAGGVFALVGVLVCRPAVF